MIVKDCNEIRLQRGRRFYLPKAERAQFGEKVLVVKYRNRLYFLNEKEAQVFQGLQEPAGIQKSIVRRLNRIIGLKTISLALVRIDGRGRLSIPPSMRKKEGMR